MILLGIDIGSSSIKVSLFDGEKGRSLAGASHPPVEMEILSPQTDWAEQDPGVWMSHLVVAVEMLREKAGKKFHDIGAIGISYQMHGLVAVDRQGEPVRNAIIWCDSRAVGIGDRAFQELGEGYCLNNLLNSPGNFTASKLRWVRENEPDTYARIHKIMLPGDYIAYRLTGEIRTTASGLSEGIFWDFEKDGLSDRLLNYYGLDLKMMPALTGTFSEQGRLTREMASKLGIKAGTPVTYRAGDQPNNALSLNVMNPGEVAATAGTSGVVYGVTDLKKFDPASRVNTFLHVNHSAARPRYGILLCLNATGIMNSWARQHMSSGDLTYEAMNERASGIPEGSEGLFVLPFGNGAERMLGNRITGASFHGLNFNIHRQGHLFRAVQEGIAFAMKYGLDIMSGLGLDLTVIRAGKSNMFLSAVFRQTFADIAGVRIELYNTDGAEGAARGAGIGAGYFSGEKEAFEGLTLMETVESRDKPLIRDAYRRWMEQLEKELNQKSKP